MKSNKNPTNVRGIPQPFKQPVGPTAFRAQSASKAAQPKMANGAVNRKPPVAPPVYRPQPVPKVLQKKSVAAHGPHAVRTPRTPVAPPVYRPNQKLIAQPKMASAAHPLTRKPPVSVSCFPGGTVQMAQKSGGGGGGDDAVHNWDNVLAMYRNGQAAKEVIAAFEAAGYYGTAQRPAILKALRSHPEWAQRKIAHSLGNDNSGLRAGTDKRIQDCKNYLIDWANKNPPSSGSKSGGKFASKGSRGASGEDDDWMEEKAYFLTKQMAGWARNGDRESMTTLARWANGRNYLAWDLLVEMARSGNANAVSELSRLAEGGNDRAWTLMLLEFQSHSSGWALPEGYTPHPGFNMLDPNWRERINIHHDPWANVQGADPSEWDE